MGTQVEQSSPPNTPPGLNPLAKLGWRIRSNKYKPTARETEVLSKCFEDGKWYYLNGALLFGAAAWSVAAYIGRYCGYQFASYSCTKRILSLDGSPLQAELLSILQEDFPDHPLLKTEAGRPKSGSPLSESAMEREDYAHGALGPVSAKDLALKIDDSGAKSGGYPDISEPGNGQERTGRIPRIWEIAGRKEALRKDDGADILADPFDLMMQTGIMVDEVNDSGGKAQDRVEKRRSRMGAKERREYDRRQYEERHEQRNY